MRHYTITKHSPISSVVVMPSPMQCILNCERSLFVSCDVCNFWNYVAVITPHASVRQGSAPLIQPLQGWQTDVSQWSACGDRSRGVPPTADVTAHCAGELAILIVLWITRRHVRVRCRSLGLEKRGGGHCTAIRRKPRHSQFTAFPIPFNLQRDTITCIQRQERAQTYHVTESRLRASACCCHPAKWSWSGPYTDFQIFLFSWLHHKKMRKKHNIYSSVHGLQQDCCAANTETNIWRRVSSPTWKRHLCDIAKVTVKSWFSVTPTF